MLKTLYAKLLAVPIGLTRRDGRHRSASSSGTRTSRAIRSQSEPLPQAREPRCSASSSSTFDRRRSGAVQQLFDRIRHRNLALRYLPYSGWTGHGRRCCMRSSADDRPPTSPSPSASEVRSCRSLATIRPKRKPTRLLRGASRSTRRRLPRFVLRPLERRLLAPRIK